MSEQTTISQDSEEFIWEQRFRPASLSEVIIPQDIKDKLYSYIGDGRIPSFMFFSPSPGTGKTTTAKALAREVGCSNPLFINASKDTSIDVIRQKVLQYATTVSVMAGQKQKVVILDECLEEDTLIQAYDDDFRIHDVRIGDLQLGSKISLPSFNMTNGEIEPDTAEVIKDREVECFEVTLEDGSVVLMSSNHPVIILENGEFVARPISCGLCVGDSVVVHKTK